jgi:hypothetical protein
MSVRNCYPRHIYQRIRHKMDASINTFIGRSAGYANTTGYWNTFIGSSAGCSNEIGFLNAFVGYKAGYSARTIENDSGTYNTFIGANAGKQNTTEDNNTIIGYYAGFLTETGTRNVFLGYRAGLTETGSNRLYIDNSDTSTPLIWGDFGTDRRVEINGGFRAVARPPLRTRG